MSSINSKEIIIISAFLSKNNLPLLAMVHRTEKERTKRRARVYKTLNPGRVLKTLLPIITEVSVSTFPQSA